MNYEDLSCAENLSFHQNQYTSSGKMSNDSVRKDSPLSGILVYLVFPTSTLFCVCLVTQSCLTLCDPHGLQPARFLYPWVSPGKNTGMGSHSLLQGILPTWGSKLCLLHCRWICYHFMVAPILYEAREALFYMKILSNVYFSSGWYFHI